MRKVVPSAFWVCSSLLLLVVVLLISDQLVSAKQELELYKAFDDPANYFMSFERTYGLAQGDVFCVSVTGRDKFDLETVCHEYAHTLINEDKVHFCGGFICE